MSERDREGGWEIKREREGGREGDRKRGREREWEGGREGEGGMEALTDIDAARRFTIRSTPRARCALLSTFFTRQVLLNIFLESRHGRT